MHARSEGQAADKNATEGTVIKGVPVGNDEYINITVADRVDHLLYDLHTLKHFTTHGQWALRRMCINQRPVYLQRLLGLQHAVYCCALSACTLWCRRRSTLLRANNSGCEGAPSACMRWLTPKPTARATRSTRRSRRRGQQHASRQKSVADATARRWRCYISSNGSCSARLSSMKKRLGGGKCFAASRQGG